MKDGLLNNKNETSKIAEKYIKKYISDLQMHMNLSDSQIIEILNACMSYMKSKNTDKSPEKKWWQLLKKNITIRNINLTK